ncbi:CbiX/SirB N-terminal domain-containing protein [Candidatus Nasuia deltocephalinicola]|uniref:CbiX/SirB N-terminal domain-containing protein n=1 Tax=Candidatus Nasuia deltocephalincola TaxID=1160784 RepID=UPI00216ADCE6|nr:CbiX/SirB N-terminal domain-containing protein [Candidatus Nasuia deltocephalinicola]
MKYNKKIIKIFLLHKNGDYNLIKNYKNKIKNLFIINRIKFFFINKIIYNFNNFIKKKINKFKIIPLLIWKSFHIKSIKKILKNLLKINKSLEIKIFKNLGNNKKLKKIIK